MKNLKMFLSAIAVLFISITFGQEMTITGIIKDKSGYLPGANVTIKGSKISTMSDFDGSYSIKAKIEDILVFSWIGCESVERKITNSDKINITIKVPQFVYCTFGVTSENYDTWQLGTLETAIESYPIAIDKTTTFDLETNFNNDVNNKTLKIYLLDNKLQEISESEFNFQNKYQIKFTTFDNKNQEYFEAYNKKAFDYLEDNFNDKWQNEINDEVLSFEEWQNN